MIGLSNLPRLIAEVVKLVDTLASGASARKGVEVQVLFWAPSPMFKCLLYKAYCHITDPRLRNLLRKRVEKHAKQLSTLR